MNYKLRGQSYAIANSSDTLLSKVGISMQNGMANPEDDGRVAYAVATACPSIPPDIVSYQSSTNFKMTLDSMEIAAFMLSMNIIILQRSKAQSEADKLSIQRKTQELTKALADIDKGLTADQVKLILGQITVTETGEQVVNEGLPLNDELKSAEVLHQENSQVLTPEQIALAKKYILQESGQL